MGMKGVRPGTVKEELPAREKRVYDSEEHNNLCLLAGNWLRKTKRVDTVSCPYVAVELVTASTESPDVFGWNYWTSVLIEVKVSRSDFIADAKKLFRQQPERGVGELRYYCCPKGLISIDELPKNWGLLYEIDGSIEVIKDAEYQKANVQSERSIYASIMRREGIKPKLFYYKLRKYE